MAENIGAQFASFGKAVGDLVTAEDRGRAAGEEIRRKRSQQEKATLLLDQIGYKYAQETDPVKKAQIKIQFNKVGGVVEEMQMFKSQWTRDMGAEALPDTIERKKVNYPAKFFDIDKPEKASFSAIEKVFSETSFGDALSNKIDTLKKFRDAPDKDYNLKLKTLMDEKSKELTDYYNSEIDPENDSIGLDSYVAQGIAEIEKKFGLDELGLAKYKAPKDLFINQHWSTKRVGKTLKRTRIIRHKNTKRKRKFSASDKEALKWAKQNPKDKRAKAILKKNGY